MRELRIIRGGRAIISLDTIFLCRPFVTTMKAMQLNESFPPLPTKDFQNHYLLVFDLTLLADAAQQLPYPELSREILILEMLFQFCCVEQITEVIVLGERLSNIQKDKFGTVAMNVYFFELVGSYKNIVTFWDFPSFSSLYYLFCFSSEQKHLKKRE